MSNKHDDDDDNIVISSPVVSVMTDDDGSDDAAAVASVKSETSGSFHLRWIRLQKTVQVKETNAGLLRGSIAAPTANDLQEFRKGGAVATTKTILAEVSGCAAPGEVLAMMGPSGSGKTSLLNCLSGRTSFDSGTITVNGRPLKPATMKRLMAKIAYVKQADVFFTHLTVRDQLGYTAFLRLPQKWPKQRKLDEVERIIQLLRLGKVAESKISMLSGGEKKRVNIGTELLTDPACLLLDEPTSGLDSTSAVALMKMLQQLAIEENKTVITSIHQPNSALFYSFDKLIMLAEGNVVYFGKPRDSLTYLREKNLACPDGYNAADHWMDLLVQDSAIEDLTTDAASPTNEIGVTEHTESSSPSVSVSETDSKTGLSKRKSAGRIRRERNRAISMTSRQSLINAWDNELIAEQLEVTTHTTDNDAGKQLPFSKYNTSWFAQYRVLVHRALKNSRSAIFTPINLIKSAALGFITGLAWFQMEYTEATVFDRSSFFFFAMTYWVFDAMFSALMAFPQERDIILKERSSGSYHLGAYFMAKTTSEMPTRLCLPTIYMTISFWMAGVSPRFDLFIYTTLISLMSVVAGESLGLVIGTTFYDMEKALTFMTVFTLALMLVGGFFVENVPTWLEWGKFLSPFKFSFDASRQLVFDRPVPCDGSGALQTYCDASPDGMVSPEDVLEFLGVQGTVGFNAALLLVIGLVPRYFAYLALRAKKEGDRQ